MDVTKENFAEILPRLEIALQDCEFVTIDFEMSGISLPGSSRPSYGDTPQERYAQMYPISSRYNIVQMGVCIFSKATNEKTRSRKGAEAKKEILIARPFNFYTFAAEGQDVVLSLSAMHFLKDQGMDFNKWVRQGVSYTNEAGEAYLVKKVEQEREQDRLDADAAAAAAAGGGETLEKSRMKLTHAADIDFVKAQMEMVTAWVKSEEVEENGGGTEEELREAARRFKELSLTRTNAFLRRALFEAIGVAYPEIVTEARNNQVVLMRLSETEKKERDAAREAARQAKMTSKLGMRLVFKAIGACGKPLVVHNGMHDLLFMMHSFNKPLPETLVGFKGQLAECFPNLVLYDTKYISRREDLLGKNLGPDTGVEGLYHTLVLEEDRKEDGAGIGPKVVLAEGFEKYAGGGEGEGGKGFAHEAGYDAYLTGAIFARMRELLREGGREREVAMKLFNYRSLFETNLGGRDELVYRKDGQLVFHLGWKKEDGPELNNDVLMKLFGERAASVSILWVDDLSAFAVVNGEEGVKEDEVLGGLQGPTAAAVQVTPYKKWLEEKEAKEGVGGGRREGGADDEAAGALAWIMKRTLRVLRLKPEEREGQEGKRLRSV